jgi:hypothetical protein
MCQDFPAIICILMGGPYHEKNRSIYKYYTIVYVVKRKEHCCNDLSSMTVSVTVRLLKGNCCQVLQSTKEIGVSV